MKQILLGCFLLAAISCNKDKPELTKDPDARCGVILDTPILDSFVYPTYYITSLVAFPEGDEVVHIHGNVTGDHDGSWFLTTYDKDSTYCYFPTSH
jgi:hypothetical protein